MILYLLLACHTPSALEKACVADSPKVSAADCYNGAYAEGYDDGAFHGENKGYDDGYAQCKADNADTGDTGDSGDTGDTAAARR